MKTLKFAFEINWILDLPIQIIELIFPHCTVWFALQYYAGRKAPFSLSAPEVLRLEWQASGAAMQQGYVHGGGQGCV